jgi:hypothetical protein
MKLLLSSPDLGDLARIVRKLVWSSIPCAVCKDQGPSPFSLWIQQDTDFPLALRLAAGRDKPRSLPHWARVFDPPPLPRKRLDTGKPHFVRSRGLAQPVTA